MARLAIFALLLLAGVARANEGDAAGFRARPEYRTLARAAAFEGSNVGEGGDCSVGVLALRLLVQGPDAREALLALLDEASLPGRLYALCGLWEVDPEAFLARVEPLAAVEEEVELQVDGCLSLLVPAGEIVRSSSPYVLRLRGPGDTIARWRDAERLPADFLPDLDIVGGGFTLDFALAAPYEARGVDELPVDRRRLTFWLEQLACPEADRVDGPFHPIEAVARFGAEALPGLRRLARHESPAVRRDVAELLGEWLGLAALGPRLAETVPLLASMLQDPADEVVAAAALALSWHGEWASAALGPMTGCLAATPPDSAGDALYARRHLLSLMGSLGAAAAPSLRSLLGHAHEDVRAGAARALGGAGEPSDARALASLLADEAPLVREAALEAIARLGHDVPEVAAALAGVLRDPEHGRLAARALGRARDAARPRAVEALARVPGDAPAAVQLEAALARLHLGGSSPGLALRILDHAVAVDPAPDDEEHVVDGLAALGRANPEARLALARALEDEAWAARAAAAIAQLGPLAADAAPVLRRRASENHTSAARRLVYADALHAVSGDAGPLVALLGSVLEPSDDRATRRDALDRLARLGPAGLGALEPLLGALRDPELRTAALAALAAIGPGAAAAAPRVRPLLAHPEARFRAEAALTLGALGTWSSELEELAERDESGRVRLAARLALRRLGR